MRSECKVWRNQYWFLKSFPTQNKTIVWNDNTKTYDFYEGVIGEKKKPVVHKPIKTTKKYYYSTCVLLGVVGVLTSIIVFLLI